MAKIAAIVFVDNVGGESRSVAPDSQTIRYKFGDGSVKDFDPKHLPEGMAHLAALHGLKQKISDGYADCGGSVEIAKGLAEAMWERLLGDEWNQKGEGVGRETDLATALAEATGQEMVAVVQKLQSMSKDERTALRKHRALAPILSRIKLERERVKLAKAEADAEGADALQF